MTDTQLLERTPLADLPVAGWYDDPAGTGQLRWWGGLAWTEHLKPAQPEPPVLPSLAELSTTHSYGVAPSYVPFSTQLYPTAATAKPTRGGGTAAIWMLAFSPIVSLVILFLVTGIGPTPPVILAAQLAHLAAYVALFLWDRAALRSLELMPSSAWWILLPNPIIYLIVRRVTLKRQGVLSHAPSNVYVLMLMVAAGFAALVAGLLWR